MLYITSQDLFCNWKCALIYLMVFVFPSLLLLSRFSLVRLCVTPSTAAHPALPSLGFSRQEHWSGLPFPPPIKFYQITFHFPPSAFSSPSSLFSFLYPSTPAPPLFFLPFKNDFVFGLFLCVCLINQLFGAFSFMARYLVTMFMCFVATC